MLLNEDYYLTGTVAKTLFHDYAEYLPIVDYHCHLAPTEVVEDKCFSGIVDAWLGGDHYKWRLMRAAGVPEHLITGDGSDWEKFEAFAETMERAVGNAVYVWTNLELKRTFGINEALSRKNAKRIFDQTNEMLSSREFSRQNLIRKFGVEVICTTDDATDDLSYHKQLSNAGTDFTMLPAFRPDLALAVDSPSFGPWITQMEKAIGRSICSFADLVAAMEERVELFAAFGSRLSDHGLDSITFDSATDDEVENIWNRGRAGDSFIDAVDVSKYRTRLLLELMRIYSEHDWVMQIHTNANRNINARGLKNLGPNTGFDAIGTDSVASPLVKLMATADTARNLPQTVLYSLNPSDWITFATILGCFQGGMAQKHQLGAAWWFNDNRSGIEQQLKTAAEQTLIGNFVGMTTDSRSFLSYTRHEFFRRIFCNTVGRWVELGEAPDDIELLGELVTDVCYRNALQMTLGSVKNAEN